MSAQEQFEMLLYIRTLCRREKSETLAVLRSLILDLKRKSKKQRKPEITDDLKNNIAG